MTDNVGLEISIPVACFRVPRAREYFETFPIPPPATVYGMLLSLVGETNRRLHETAEIAVAALSEPGYSVVLRTLWRVKNKHDGLGLGTNRRPDFQELLTDVRLAVWVRAGKNESFPISLAERLRNAFADPTQITRFGALSLGESTHLVDEVKISEKFASGLYRMLLAENDGDLSLPIWADHVRALSRWGQYSLTETNLNSFDEIPSNAWTTIRRDSLISSSDLPGKLF